MKIDQSKSPATEDQMELMMQMDKFLELYGSYNNDVYEFPSCDHTINIAASMPHFFDNNNPLNNVASPSFPNMPSNTSFDSGTTPIQETPMPPYNSSVPSSQKRIIKSMEAMRETSFRIAAMQPIHIDPEAVKPPKRRNVKISKDPQSVAARHRRERTSERIRVLQRLVPGGTKMDTASMLDEAIHYVKFLKTQVLSLERDSAINRHTGIGFPATLSTGNCIPFGKAYHHQSLQNGDQH